MYKLFVNKDPACRWGWTCKGWDPDWGVWVHDGYHGWSSQGEAMIAACAHYKGYHAGRVA